MKTFILVNEHAPAECAISYAAWKGFDSPLRGHVAQSTCARYSSNRLEGSADAPPVHEIWWTAAATDRDAALAQLPPYVRVRTRAREVREVNIG